MERPQLVLNELSLNPEPMSVHVVREWMLNLQRTAGRAIDRGFQEVLLVPVAFLSASLGEGYSFSHWLEDALVELEVRQALQSWVSWGPFLDDIYLSECEDRIEVIHVGALGIGLGVAFVRDHAVVSIGVEPWNAEEDEIRVLVRRRREASDPVDEAEGTIRNLHSPASVERRLRWIAERCCVKPRYENPGTHDPSSGLFRGGGTMTTLLPADAEEVYATAIPSNPRDSLSSWWGINADGYLYRYEASWPGPEPVAHWNGTTSPGSARRIEDREVPVTVRDYFPHRKR